MAENRRNRDWQSRERDSRDQEPAREDEQYSRPKNAERDGENDDRRRLLEPERDQEAGSGYGYGGESEYGSNRDTVRGQDRGRGYGYGSGGYGRDPEHWASADQRSARGRGYGYGGSDAFGTSGYGYERPDGGGYARQRARHYERGAGAQGWGYGDRERGAWDRTVDEVSSWFGDRDAERRRESDQHRGRGPKNYKRSDDRIREDVCDRLSDDGLVDASDIDVKVAETVVTLEGTVEDRFQRRRAEDCAESVSGVTHVQNNLRNKPSGKKSK